MTRRVHRVTFFSPGTMVAETDTRQIGEWDTVEACRMATTIKQRHGAIPYGFRFETLLTADPIDDGEGGELQVTPKVVEKSGMHYINGKVETLVEIEERNLPSERILRENMRGNGWDKVVHTANGYRWTQPLEKGDKVVNADGVVVLEVTG